MSWFGKIMGGGVGFMFGGPIGALIGASLGHALIDDKVRMQRAETGSMSSLEQRQAVFFTATFAMLGKIAKADGKVCEHEIKVVREFMNTRLKLDPAAQQFAIGLFNQAKDNNTPFEDYARQFGQIFSHDPQLRMIFYELLFSVAMADGELHPAEDALLRASPVHIGLHSDVYETVKRQFVGSLSHHYAMLGLQDGADLAEVKRAYRKLASEYHPDKIVSKGLPDDFVEFAESKFREINEAYAAITKSR
jgi:DnaJ like chaperone protein